MENNESNNIVNRNIHNTESENSRSRLLKTIDENRQEEIIQLFQDTTGVFLPLSNTILEHTLSHNDWDLLNRYIDYSLNCLTEYNQSFLEGPMNDPFRPDEITRLNENLYSDILNALKKKEDEEALNKFNEYVFSCVANREDFCRKEFLKYLNSNTNEDTENFMDFILSANHLLIEESTRNRDFARQLYIDALNDDSSYQNEYLLGSLLSDLLPIHTGSLFPEIPREYQPLHDGTFIPLNLLENHFNYAIDHSQFDSLQSLIEFFNNFNLIIPQNILDQIRNIIQNHQNIIETQGGELANTLRNLNYSLDSYLNARDIRAHREARSRAENDHVMNDENHNASSNATKIFFENIQVNFDYSLLDCDKAFSFINQTIEQHIKNSYFCDSLKEFIKSLQENASYNLLIREAASIVSQAVSDHPEMQDHILNLFLRYFIFENFVANSTHTKKWQDKHVNFLYETMNEIQIPSLFPPIPNLFQASCAPGLNNRITDFILRLNALIENQNPGIQESFSDYFVEEALENAFLKILQERPFGYISPYIEAEKTEKAFIDYSLEIVKKSPIEHYRFKEKIIKKSKNCGWTKGKKVFPYKHRLNIENNIQLNYFLKMRLQDVSQEGGACWVRAVMQESNANSQEIRQRAVNLVTGNLGNENVRQALLDGMRALIHDTQSENSDVRIRSLNTFQNFFNFIENNEDTRHYLEYLNSLSFENRLEAFLDGVYNEDYIERFLSNEHVLHAYVTAQFGNNNSWGSEADVRALAHGLQRNLRVYTREQQDGVILVNDYEGDPLEIFYDGNHYQIVKKENGYKIG